MHFYVQMPPHGVNQYILLYLSNNVSSTVYKIHTHYNKYTYHEVGTSNKSRKSQSLWFSMLFVFNRSIFIVNNFPLGFVQVFIIADKSTWNTHIQILFHSKGGPIARIFTKFLTMYKYFYCKQINEMYSFLLSYAVCSHILIWNILNEQQCSRAYVFTFIIVQMIGSLSVRNAFAVELNKMKKKGKNVEKREISWKMCGVP